METTMNRNTQPKLITMARAAEILGVHKTTVLRNPNIDKLRLGKASVRVRKQDIDAILQGRPPRHEL